MIYEALLKKISRKALGCNAVDAMYIKDGKITWNQFRKQRRRLNKLRREFAWRPKHLSILHQSCVAHAQAQHLPLALISQIQRSGGSLLSQLFDGHPEIHAHPHELKIGFPSKYLWPKIYLDEDPTRWLETLFEPSVLNHFRNGYKKQRNMEETFLFLFLPSVQKELFVKQLHAIESVTQRDVLDAYMTSYFSAWLNNQNNSGSKKLITAFTARLSMDKDNMKSFFEIYPDGRLISIIRDPKNWYPSAANHKPLIYGDIKKALLLWKQSAAAMLHNRERYGDRVCVLNFEDLICNTEAVMRYLAEFLNIGFDDCLLIPSFNRMPIKPNTSFKDKQHGIIESTLNRYKSLERKDLKLIEDTTADLYARAKGICPEF